MNRMQKISWVSFPLSLTIAISYPAIFIILFSFPSYLWIFPAFGVGVIVALSLGLIWVYKKRQGPTEPDCDERDKHISRQGVITSLSVFAISIFASDAVFIFRPDGEGTLQPVVLPVVHFGLSLWAVAIYYGMTLVQYYIKGKGDAA